MSVIDRWLLFTGHIKNKLHSGEIKGVPIINTVVVIQRCPLKQVLLYFPLKDKISLMNMKKQEGEQAIDTSPSILFYASDNYYYRAVCI